MSITVNNLEHVLQHLRSLNTELAPQVNILYYLSIENNSVIRFGDILGNGRISLCHIYQSVSSLKSGVKIA